MAIHKLGFLFQFLNIHVTRPHQAGEYPHKSAESGDECAELLIIRLSEERKEDIHHHTDQDHYHGYINVRMV